MGGTKDECDKLRALQAFVACGTQAMHCFWDSALVLFYLSLSLSLSLLSALFSLSVTHSLNRLRELRVIPFGRR